MITTDAKLFPTASAHHTHQLVLLKQLCAEGIYQVPTSESS